MSSWPEDEPTAPERTLPAVSVALEDIDDVDLGDIKTPDVSKSAVPVLAHGSDIHALTPDQNEPGPERVALPDQIDVMLVAYLLDLDVDIPLSDAAALPRDDTPVTIDGEATKPERPKPR